jgi:hypothetical protein
MSALTAPIREAVEALRKGGYAVELHEEKGVAVVVIQDYMLPAGWIKQIISLLLKVPASYPAGNPDMFWTDEDLTLVGGAIPKQADLIEEILGRRWRRFSWHPASWNPGADDLRTYLQFIARRLARSE